MLRTGARSSKQDDLERSILVRNWYRIHPVNDQILKDDADESYSNPTPESSAKYLPVELRKPPRTSRISIETLDIMVHKCSKISECSARKRNVDQF